MAWKLMKGRQAPEDEKKGSSRSRLAKVASCLRACWFVAGDGVSGVARATGPRPTDVKGSSSKTQKFTLKK